MTGVVFLDRSVGLDFVAIAGAEGGSGAWAGLIAAFTSATFGVADTKGACTCELGFWGAFGSAFGAAFGLGKSFSGGGSKRSTVA